MSEVMLGVLEMPDDWFWDDEPITRYQHNQIRREAAAEIRDLRADSERLYWMMRHLRGSAIRETIGDMSDTSDIREFRRLIDSRMGHNARANLPPEREARREPLRRKP
ncbi:MAG TPA: hypothetical protein VFM97_00360 [Gammaproteobacteria bacterium]|nr:hypothetical protein [Gammaproteobacteria bacterium]